jgi:transcription elongation factor GreA
MADTRELSRATYDRLKAELEDLTGAGRIDIANKIETARALGDLSENGDYHAAKDQQGKMEARIRQIQGILLDAVVVEGGPSDGTVVVGSIVGIDFGGGDVEKYLVGHIEERHEDYDVLSPDSPLGSSLMGKGVGADAQYEVKGNVLTVKIVSVD